jgi:hypothetical protein
MSTLTRSIRAGHLLVSTTIFFNSYNLFIS